MNEGHSMVEVYLRESPYDNPMELEIVTMQNKDGLFIFDCTNGEIIMVPFNNVMLVERNLLEDEDDAE